MTRPSVGEGRKLRRTIGNYRGEFDQRSARRSIKNFRQRE
jgi:hypothetical protein